MDAERSATASRFWHIRPLFFPEAPDGGILTVPRSKPLATGDLHALQSQGWLACAKSIRSW